jgi:hypothetical protein
MSPELIDPRRFGLKDSRPTISSDCYALGMVIYETINGNLPFHEYSDLAVVIKVLAGERPPRGVLFERSLWKLLEQCWTSQPYDRPSIEDVLQCLEMVSNLLEPHPPEADEEIEKDGNPWDSSRSSSSVSNRSTVIGRSTAVPSGSSYLNDHPLGPVSTAARSSIVEVISEAGVDRPGRDAIDPGHLVSGIDLNDGSTYQASAIQSRKPLTFV